MNKWLYVLVLILCVSCQLTWAHGLTQDYAVWSGVNADGSWTQAAETAIAATSLSQQFPRDIQKFCPNYLGLNMKSKVMFWVGLLSAMAKYESNFKPETQYRENFRDRKGKWVVSRGLLQISIESANQKRYACDIATAQELHNPLVNLSCGARILSRWVENDGVVAGTYRKNKGGARYWSVLRSANKSLTKISGITRKFSFCRV